MAQPEETTLDGFWRLERTGGLLPPLAGVRKRIAGRRGWTIVGRLELPLDVVGLELRYRGLFRGIVDVLTADGPDAFRGETFAYGVRAGSFRMVRSSASEAGGASP